MSQHIVHWDDLDSNHGEAGSISSHWTNLSRAAGSVRIRANRISVDPGKRSTPLHAESDEEIFFILRGSGLAWQREDESDADVTYEVRAGDYLVHLVDAEAHTLVAGTLHYEILEEFVRHHRNTVCLTLGRFPIPEGIGH